jgi:predicted transcriptional regulator of viral defense system
MSDLEQRLYFALGEKEQRVFMIRDIVDLLGVSPQHARNLAARMVQKGAMQRVKPGLFVRIPENVILHKGLYREDAILIADKAVEDAFLSHYTAITLHGLEERYTNRIYVTTRRRQRNIHYHDVHIQFITVVPERFFGMEPMSYSNDTITVADRERAILDAVNVPRYSGGWPEVISCLRNLEEVDWKKLESYLARFGNKSLTRRIGYLLEKLENVSLPEDVKGRMRELSGDSIYYFGSPREGSLDKEWNLVVPDRIRRVLLA